jgi:hypothetical protein
MAEHLRIYDGAFGKEFSVTPKQAIQLELALNKSQYGHTWKHIGDFLYDYGVGKIFKGNLNVTQFQLTFLNQLAEEAKIIY